MFRVNIERVNRADAVFAYVDRAEAYGSAFELGHASAMGKPIFVGFPPGVRWRKDMWFSPRPGSATQLGTQARSRSCGRNSATRSALASGIPVPYRRKIPALRHCRR